MRTSSITSISASTGGPMVVVVVVGDPVLAIPRQTRILTINK